MRILSLIAAFLLPVASFSALNDIRGRLAEIIGDADVGIAVVTADGEILERNGNVFYDMASVMKFHQAAALARTMSFDSIMAATVTVESADLHKNTWSPMRAAISELPYEASLVELLDYSLNMSDNNAADLIFSRFMSPSKVECTLRESDLADSIRIRSTEAQMHSDSLAMLNETTPMDAARCIYRFFTADTTASATLIKAVMARDTPFGKDRIPAGVEQGEAKVFHKTGTGFDNPDGTPHVVNDLAFVSYKRPGGYGCYALAVFVRDYASSAKEAEKLIAAISREVWSAVIVGESLAAAKSTTVSASQGKKGAPVQTEKYSLGDALFMIGSAFVSEAIDRKINGD